ncbi:MAG: hypothetical protein NTY19_09100 [Planctomycetota bacterium]|nr:hypothetical protein [Planctomycetota bacterium]
MRISFDLDDTLICYREEVPCEPPVPLLLRWLVADEPLRLGIRTLIRDLWTLGWKPWIYTTSYRRPTGVRRWLRLHGVTVAGVINQDVHEAYFRGRSDDCRPTKYPPAFAIDLHVDDSDGVRVEGEQHGFSVVVVRPDDRDWTKKVLAAVTAIKR